MWRQKGLLERGMVLDVSGMKQITLDKEGRQITVGGGTTFDMINAVTENFGLAVPSGFGFDDGSRGDGSAGRK